MNKEEIYDEMIAPLLKEASEIAFKHKIPMLAVCEYSDGGNIGKTYAIRARDRDLCGAPFLLCVEAADANGNLDAMVISLARTKRVHNSIVLHQISR